MKIRRLFIYICLAFSGVGFIVAPSRWFHGSPMVFLAHSLFGNLIRGNLNGQHNGPDVPVELKVAEPGDILLCHNPHGAYGYWTHAVLYVGNNQVVDANDFSRGTVVEDASHYRNYDEVILLRPNASLQVRRAAADAARSRIGTPYDPLSALRDSRSAYCSKLIWEAYANVGVQLCKASGWVLPDQIATSAHVVPIAHWSTSEGEKHSVEHQ